jgi:hypothetical protein
VEILTHTNMKTQTKHTPGPWFRACNSPAGIQVVTCNQSDEPNALIATVNHCVINPKQDVSDEVGANARLIAAAPDLLVALEQCVSIIVRHANATLGDGVVTLQVARAAIAKAQGE